MNRNAIIVAVVAVALVAAIGISLLGSDGNPVEVATTAPTTTTTTFDTVGEPVDDPGPANTDGPTECTPLGDIAAGREGKPTTVALPTEPTKGDVVTTVLEPGDGPTITDSSYVTVDYLGISCSSGEQFDSSWDRADPITIAMPSAQPTDTAFSVIPGWNQGLLDQQQGALVQLDIPSELAYGASGSQGITPNDPLTFVVRIIEVSDTPPAS